MMKAIYKGLIGYFSIVGLLAHIALLFGFFFALNYFHLTPSQFVVKLADKSGLEVPWLVEAISPARRFDKHAIDGNLLSTHPRIILPELAKWDGNGMPSVLRQRVALYQRQNLEEFNPCRRGDSVMNLAACWVSSGNEDVAKRLIAALKKFQLETPDVQARYGNGWQLAFAYDLLLTYSGITADERAQIEAKLEYALRDYLTVLDDSAPSLWHGRTSLASMAWLCAVVLDPAASDSRPGLIARAQGHFLDVVRAAEITEGWPEGYNYWIQNRAFIFSLAASAYLNGLEKAEHHERIRKLLRRIGMWHIYATRPDNRIEGFGDEGSRVDLKDETRRVIDIIAQATRDPVLASFSRYIAKLHGRESYYRGYRWGFRLFNDPSLGSITTATTADKGLAAFGRLLPKAEIFGRGGLNQAFIHSDWSPSETFISFHAGQVFTHHGHYDAGHFTLFKQAPLAINSSTYGGGFMSAHRLNYAIRTVAKNALLILRPGERVQPNRFFEKNISDGGQRVIIPTGSSIQSVADWATARNEDEHYAAGQVDHFDYRKDDYAYISADLTHAYNTPAHDEGGSGGKVSKVQRQLVYLFDEDRLLVHDRVVSTDPAYTKKWLLHTINRPQVARETLLKGSVENGITETHDATLMVKNGDGALRVDRLYPEDAVIRLVGGPDYQFYVESDGDDSDLDGENFNQGATLRPWFDNGMWRMEIQPQAPRREDEFLVVLSPGMNDQRRAGVASLGLSGVPAKGVATERNLIVFLAPAAHGELQVTVPGGQRRLLVFGIPVGMAVKVQSQTAERTSSSNSEGVAGIDLAKGEGSLRLSW